jgi:ubiquinone/menaquinone biosynthesis C-methylase UbiE
VVLPGVLKLLGEVEGKAILDVACGQGVLCRVLAQGGAKVTGVDAAEPLIRLARERGDAGVTYQVGDARELDFLPGGVFDAATCILAIQNIHPIQGVFDTVGRRLKERGRFVVVMMHPCFRGAKESSWGWDEGKKVQYRRVDRYMVPRKSPIFANPGKRDGTYTWTFHKPIEYYVKACRKAGLLVDAMEEWCSHKVSDSGPRAGAENMARKEIPMFMAIRAVKVAMGE